MKSKILWTCQNHQASIHSVMIKKLNFKRSPNRRLRLNGEQMQLWRLKLLTKPACKLNQQKIIKETNRM